MSPPPQGMPGGVTPALSTVWATGEEKIGVQRAERAQSGRTQCGLIILRSAIPILFDSRPPSTRERDRESLGWAQKMGRSLGRQRSLAAPDAKATSPALPGGPCPGPAPVASRSQRDPRRDGWSLANTSPEQAAHGDPSPPALAAAAPAPSAAAASRRASRPCSSAPSGPSGAGPAAWTAG